MPSAPRKNARSSSAAKPVVLTPQALSIQNVVDVARRGAKVSISKASMSAMLRSRRVVERCLTDGQAHYGINTGFGSLAKQRVGLDDLKTLQRNLVRSHSAGVGEPLREELVRAMMLILAASLARGLSGVRPVVVETLVKMINAGVVPVVPSIGSVGASGDLAPLAHVALCLIGEGQATISKPANLRAAGFSPRGSASTATARPMPAAKALEKAGIKPLELHAKEGLALINGTHLMCAEGALLSEDALRLCQIAELTLAMSIDGCRASHSYLDERLYLARRNAWCDGTARVIRAALAGGKIAESHLENDPRVQDPYSLRAGVTVQGAASAQIFRFRHTIESELGAVSDNPLVFAKGVRLPLGTDRRPYLHDISNLTREDAVISGANFHGMPLAIPLDCLAIVLCHIAGISERRSYLMTGAFEPESHLKPFLTPRPGLQSGLMIAQYTAAACVNEMIGLATPASVSNITTCAGMEDYNSWGPRAAAKARRSLELATKVVAIEMLCAAAALDVHAPLKSGKAVEAAKRIIRTKVKPQGEDRVLTNDIEAIATLISTGAFDNVV
ncbi:MAG: histidine ammonia-lyase [Phycisphaerales bacterium]|nr:histidine ammonia-lyase [Phycisphaerales bacterium]